MELVLSCEEERLLMGVLERRQRELLRELSRTRHHEFKATLKDTERLVESVLNKLRTAELVSCNS